ncbi:hypothetical protein [Anderseniella sp. Alg231-50]|uniref:hypothetical protein n=1 Tax=Anderseniella sp. Alg231-50 TaxID=1922226 RepID=UPI000D556A5D
MKKTLLATSVALFAFAGPAGAADFERDLGLIVSGVVDSWAGVQFIDDGTDDDTVFTNGGEGLLSLPLGENISIQSDVKYEYNTYATESAINNDAAGPRFSYQFATHGSWRDPSRGLFGAFGGMGSVDAGILGGGSFRQDHRFVGGEAQIYIDNITLYGQGGYVDTVNDFGGLGLDDGFFARGVVRYFPTSDSRIQLEGTYINIDYVSALTGDMETFSVKARYDFLLTGMPVIGDTPIYIGYRGTFRENCSFDGADRDDHTIMVGTSYSFSGDRLTVDRQGATLDTPDFAIGCTDATS